MAIAIRFPVELTYCVCVSACVCASVCLCVGACVRLYICWHVCMTRISVDIKQKSETRVEVISGVVSLHVARSAATHSASSSEKPRPSSGSGTPGVGRGGYIHVVSWTFGCSGLLSDQTIGRVAERWVLMRTVDRNVKMICKRNGYFCGRTAFISTVRSTYQNE